MRHALAAVKKIRSLAPDDEFERLQGELIRLADDLRERDALLRIAAKKGGMVRKSTR